MKKIFIVALLCAIGNCLKAQNTFPLNGNVGIGTTSPALDIEFKNVDQTVESVGLTWYNGAPLHYGIYKQAGAWSYPNYQQMRIQWDTGIQLGAGIDNSTPGYGKSYVEIVSGKGLMVSSGNVGIGTTTPAAKLQINTAAGGGPFQPVLSFVEGANPTYGFTFLQDDQTTGDLQLNRVTAGINTQMLTFQRNTGNLGIGTTDPGSYKLAVNGTIHSKAVIIDLIGWPDYVFKRNYKLMPLAQVKSYIDRNHHLPEMPTDKEVENRGLDVGEMNKLLTKKVEELTLYLIEKDKREIEQDELIKKMERRLSALEKQ